jgi:hypothetical protein
MFSFLTPAERSTLRGRRLSFGSNDSSTGTQILTTTRRVPYTPAAQSASSASRSASASRSPSIPASPVRSAGDSLEDNYMVRRKIEYGPTSKKFMQEYMYEGKIKRAPSVFLGPKKRYYTDPRGDSTFTYEESIAQQSMQGKTINEIRKNGDLSFAVGVPRRLIESNFLITINPNRKWGAEGEDSAARELFNKTMNLLTSKDEFFSILKVPQSTRATSSSPDLSGHYRNDTFSDIVTDTDIKGVVEIGETQKRMHAHVIVEMKHYGMIQMCPKTIRTNFTQTWNKLCQSRAYRDYGLRKGPYVDVQLLKQKNALQIVRRYLRK